MGLFSSPKCPHCGSKLRLVSRPLIDAWRCDNCVRANTQAEELRRLKQEIERLKTQNNQDEDDETI